MKSIVESCVTLEMIFVSRRRSQAGCCVDIVVSKAAEKRGTGVKEQRSPSRLRNHQTAAHSPVVAPSTELNRNPVLPFVLSRNTIDDDDNPNSM